MTQERPYPGTDSKFQVTTTQRYVKSAYAKGDNLHYDEMSQQEKEDLAQLVQSQISFDETPQADSDRAVKSKGIKAALDKKVDKVTGKQLSTEDYTTADKNKLGDLPTNSELQAALDGKQATISDLSDIRNGAAAGELT